MGSIITTISLTEQDAVLLEELRKIDRKRFSPTSILRRALLDARQEVGIETQSVREKDKKIENLAERIHILHDFLNKKGLAEEYIKEVAHR